MFSLWCLFEGGEGVYPFLVYLLFLKQLLGRPLKMRLGPKAKISMRERQREKKEFDLTMGHYDTALKSNRRLDGRRGADCDLYKAVCPGGVKTGYNEIKTQPL